MLSEEEEKKIKEFIAIANNDLKNASYSSIELSKLGKTLRLALKVLELNKEIKYLIVANNELAEEVTVLRFLNNACKCNTPQRTSIEEITKP